jgi:putative AbiEii toxin of type IV toxin-antitoxin system/AAA ATPase-like protein/OLD-like protein
MYLQELHVENYRSLEKTSLEGLTQFNVLIGPNNSGKSALLGAVEYISRVIRGEAVDTSTVVTARDLSRSLRFRLRFALRKDQRTKLIDRLVGEALSSKRREAIENSPLLQRIDYTFATHRNSPQVVHLIETSVLAEDGKWVAMQVAPDITFNNPPATFRNIAEIIAASAEGRLDADALDVKTKGGTQISLNYNFGAPGVHDLASALLWPLLLISDYLRQAFFFSPFRHSLNRMAAQEAQRLEQNGSNLAQMLHTVQSNNTGLFRQIESFLSAALHDLGALQTPLIGGETEVAIRLPRGDYLIRLQDTGGGVEQLLMIATVLNTTGEESSLFLEEPESHLHPGAQRFLLERMSGTGRQVIITTHSPVFVNAVRPRSLYRVSYRDERSVVAPVREPEALSDVLSDIGARNSDVLMSDAVVFVEGPGDQGALMAWSETLGMSLSEAGVAPISMGGADQAIKAAPVQADVLAGISQKAPVPHMFVLDRDERGDSEIIRVKRLIGEAACFLEAREIENYLLAPRAILKAVRAKCTDGSLPVPGENDESLTEIERLIAEAAESLYSVVLVKRIRAQLPPLVGGVLPKDALEKLLPLARSDDLAKTLRRELESHVKGYLDGLDIERMVGEERQKLSEEWKDAAKRLRFAPGEDILSRVFEKYKLRYSKPRDTVRLARVMGADEIPAEIKEIVSRAAGLGRPRLVGVFRGS